MKKIISILLAAALCVSTLAGCASPPTVSSAVSKTEGASSTANESKTEAPPSGEVVKFTYVIPGEVPPEYERGIKAINDKLKADGVGIEAEFKYIAWDVWDQKINLMLSTGDKFDAFHVMNDRVSLANYASRGALAEITEIFTTEGKNILANVPELAIKNCQVGDKQYGIPAFWVETALNEQASIRSDILEKFNLTMPKTFEELTETFKQVMAKWDGNQKPYFPSIAINERIPYFFSEDNTFSVYNNFIYVGQDGKIANYYETDAFKEAAKNAKIWYDAGLINPDILTVTQEQNTNQLNTGEWFVMNGTMGSVATIRQTIPEFKVDNISWLDITKGEPAIRPYGVKNLQAVPRSSENPSAAVKFFNWMYGDQANFDLVIYGEEGTDYKKGENRTVELIVDAESGKTPYNFSSWMAGNINFGYVDSAAPPDVNAHLYTIDAKATDGIAAMLSFDASAVQTQFADVQTQISAVLTPMAWGVTDYDSGITQAIELLKKAGADQVIEEFKKQLDATK